MLQLCNQWRPHFKPTKKFAHVIKSFFFCGHFLKVLVFLYPEDLSNMATAYPARVPSAFPFLLWSRAVPSHSVIRLLSSLIFSYINLSCYNSLDEELANIWRIWLYHLASWGKVNKHSQADDKASIFSGKDTPVCMVRAFPPRSAAPSPAPTWPQEGPVLRVGQGRRGWRPRCP